MHPGLLVGAGFLIGAFGSKVVSSKPVHKAAVASTRLGLKAKSCVETTIDDAKAEIDDIVAEAEFLNDVEAESKDNDDIIDVECEETVETSEENSEEETK